MMSAAGWRACSAPSTGWRPTVTRFCPFGPRAWATWTLPPVGQTLTRNPVSSRSRNTVSRTTFGAATVRLESVVLQYRRRDRPYRSKN